MNDFVIACDTANELSTAMQNFLHENQKQIRLCNVKLTTKSEGKSPWFCDVLIEVHENILTVFERENNVQIVAVPWTDLLSVKLRPYYYAACIGNKNLVFLIKDSHHDRTISN